MQAMSTYRPNWPPPVALVDYRGPYPRQQLEQARRLLISSLTNPSATLDQLKPRIGLDSVKHGVAHKPLPVPVAVNSSSYVPCSERPRTQESASPSNVKLIQARSINIDDVTRASPEVSRNTSGRSYMNNSRITSPSANNYWDDSSYHLDSLFHESPDKGRLTNAEPVASGSVGASRSKGNLVVIDLTDGENDSNYQVPTYYSGIAHDQAKRPLDVVDSPSQKKLKTSNSGTPYTWQRSQNATSNSGYLNKSQEVVLTATSSSKTITQKTPSSISVESSPETTAVSTQRVALTSQNAVSFTIYKCDFCAYRNKTWDATNEHLTSAQHFSASLYNATHDQNGSADTAILVSIKHMVAIMNKHSKSKALVVACPQCRDVFEDIFMCSLHYKYSHSPDDANGEIGGGYYAICPVIQHETVRLSRIAECQTCFGHYGTHSELHKHWKSVPDHHPLSSAPTGDRIFTLFSCPYCNKMFRNNFILCKTHTLAHEFGGDQWSGSVAVEVRYVLQPKRREQLLPLDTAGSNVEGIKAELCVLENTCRHLGNMSCSKAKVKKLAERMRCLREMIQSCD